jgi:hypothetical protein
VIDYEIRMLEHCAGRIIAVDHATLSDDELAILEAFLLHFRIRAWAERLNKFLAHPTERRYTTKRSWPVEQMRDEMRRLVALWRRAWAEP